MHLIFYPLIIKDFYPYITIGKRVIINKVSVFKVGFKRVRRTTYLPLTYTKMGRQFKYSFCCETVRLILFVRYVSHQLI